MCPPSLYISRGIPKWGSAFLILICLLTVQFSGPSAWEYLNSMWKLANHNKYILVNLRGEHLDKINLPNFKRPTGNGKLPWDLCNGFPGFYFSQVVCLEWTFWATVKEGFQKYCFPHSTILSGFLWVNSWIYCKMGYWVPTEGYVFHLDLSTALRVRYSSFSFPDILFSTWCHFLKI